MPIVVAPLIVRLLSAVVAFPTGPFRITVFVAEVEVRAELPETAPRLIVPVPLLKVVSVNKLRAAKEMAAFVVLIVPAVVVVLAVLVSPALKLETEELFAPRVTPLVLLKVTAEVKVLLAPFRIIE